MFWSDIDGLDKINSPGLLVDPDRVARNVQRMIEIVGGTDSVARLRPHVKTHKMPAAIRLQMDAGIDRFKTATLSEAEMVAMEGAADVLLAHQVVGPKIDCLISLMERFPNTRFSTIVDDEGVVEAIGQRLFAKGEQSVRFVDRYRLRNASHRNSTRRASESSETKN